MSDQEIRFPDLIAMKRDGDELSPTHIRQLVNGLMDNSLHHAQLGAMLMAIYLRGMNREEMVMLTKTMLGSGESLEWPAPWSGLMVDKHSTGGVGDKISLPLAPALAACGLKVPMISGRSLGHTGGTLDKLESIPGYSTYLSTKKMKEVLDNVGCCIVSQSESLVPADKIMYSFRDITGTVASVPLIVSSIISKKAAEGLSALVLDVKCGKGSFMKNLDSANQLAHALVATSEGLGIKTSAYITDMDYPIGMTIGNALEVLESIDCLLGKGPQDLRDLICIEGGELLFLNGKVKSTKEGQEMIAQMLDNGQALNKFKHMLIHQGVSEYDANRLCSSEAWSNGVLDISKHKTELKVTRSGVISSLDSLACAEVTAALGAGRTQPGEEVAKDVGLHLNVSLGMEVKEGDVWATVYHRQLTIDETLKRRLEMALGISPDNSQMPKKKTRILGYVSGKEALKVVFPCQ